MNGLHQAMMTRQKGMGVSWWVLKEHGRFIYFLPVRIALCLFLISTLALGLAEDKPLDQTVTITQARQVLELTAGEANLKKIATLTGVITCYDAAMGLCFVQDESAGVYIHNAPSNIGLKEGQRVMVQGVTIAGLYTPVVAAAEMRILGEGEKPAPKSASLDDLLSGSMDSQWVEVEGIVRWEKPDWRHWVLVLAAGENRLEVRVLSYPNGQPPRLADSLVKVRGVMATKFNAQKQLAGFQLLAPSLADVQVIQAAPADPYAAPLVQGRGLLAYSAHGNPGHRVRVKGVALARMPDHAFYLKDASGAFRVNTQLTNVIEPGDIIEALGFPARGDYSPMLQDAIFRKMGAAPAPQPSPVQASDALSGQIDGNLVQVEARLVSFDSHSQPGSHLVLEAAKRVIHAQAPPGTDLERLTTIPVGSLVRVTGICQVQSDANGKPTGWRMEMRSADDIILLQRPGQWLIQRLAISLGIAALAACAGLFWSFWLRRRIQEQRETIHLLEVTKAALRESENRWRGSLEEKQRIARDLHDDIIQSIYAIGLGIEDCVSRLPEAPEKVAERLRATLQALNRLIRNVRQFIIDLDTPRDQELDFADELAGFVESLGKLAASAVRCNVAAEAAAAIPARHRPDFFFIAREGISNSLRHARASLIQVSLRQEGDRLRLEVADDGAGFDQSGVKKSGFGLKNLEARARKIGARLDLQSAPGKGTRLILELPIP